MDIEALTDHISADSDMTILALGEKNMNSTVKWIIKSLEFEEAINLKNAN